MKIFYLILGFFLSSYFSFSQTGKKGDSNFRTLIGFELGRTLTEMKGESIELQTKDIGAVYNEGVGNQFALRMKHEFYWWLYLKSGVGYFEKKGHVSGSYFLHEINGEFSFVQIPLLLGIQPFKIDNRVVLGLESGFSMNNIYSASDNLEKGLHPDNEVSRNSVVYSFIFGLNMDVYLNKFTTFNVSYQYSKDLDYYFNRTYTWYDFDTDSYISKDYDLRFCTQGVTFGLLFTIIH